MLKQAWRSYLTSLHSGNIKKLRESAAYLWSYIILLPIMATALIQENGYGDFFCAVYLRMLLPVGLMIWSDLGSKYLMPKALFLCPMKVEERREYLHCVLGIKIGVMVLSSFCVELIWSIFHGFRIWEVLLMPFLFFLLGIGQYAGYGVKRDERGNVPNYVEDKHGNKVPVWMNAILLVCALAAVTFITGYDLELLETGNGKDALLMLGFAGICILFAIFFAYRIVKGQFKYVIEQSSDYELHFNVKGKVEGPKKYDLFAK